jgi:hypothetical protein
LILYTEINKVALSIKDTSSGNTVSKYNITGDKKRTDEFTATVKAEVRKWIAGHIKDRWCVDCKLSASICPRCEHKTLLKGVCHSCFSNPETVPVASSLPLKRKGKGRVREEDQVAHQAKNPRA